MGYALFILAYALFIPLTIMNIPFVLWKHRKRRAFFRTLNEYFLEEATAMDRYGNRSLRTLWNYTLQKDGYPFGNINETISSVLGKNQFKGTLTLTGKILVWILNTLDKNHCANAVKHDYEQ